jgi:hypothetical protein
MRAARARACLALLALSCAAADALPTCWRATRVWALDSVTGTTELRTGVASTTIGTAPVAGVRSDLSTQLDSLLFTGSTSVVLPQLQFGAPFTVAAWARPQVVAGGIFSVKNIVTGDSFSFYAGYAQSSSAQSTVNAWCAAGQTCCCSTNTCASDCWGHYAVSVAANGNVIYYYNGKPMNMTFSYGNGQASSSTMPLAQQVFTDVRIGKDASSLVTGFFAGAMAMLQLVPSVLSAADVASLAAGQGCLGSAPLPPLPPRPPPLPPPPSPPPPPPPPPSPTLNLVNLQAQLTSLAALVPPTCTSPSFLQRTASGWLCKAPVPSLATASGWCQAAPSTGAVTCSAAAPQAASPGFSCLPPGGAWMGYNATAGWYCVCQPGWSGAACTTPAPVIAGVFCGVPPPCATGQYAYVNGAFVCMQLACAPTADRVAQCAALGALYSATGGTVRLTTGAGGSSGPAAWLNASLGITTDYCTFAGVLCTSGTSVITGLAVYGAVSGTIPAQLGLLTALQQLTISTSLISGTIPPQLGLLTALTSLFIDSNAGLVGTVPASFGNLTQLNALSLSGSQLCGVLPPGLVAVCSSSATCYGSQLPSCVASPPPPSSPPPVAASPGGVASSAFPQSLSAGLFARYTPASFSPGAWADVSGFGRTATASANVALLEQSGAGSSSGFSAPAGDRTDTMDFLWTFPNTYTLCTLVRARSTSYAGRIINGNRNTNTYIWGHDCAGSTQVAGYHYPTMDGNTWNGGVVPNKDDWVWMCAVNSAAQCSTYVNGRNYCVTPGWAAPGGLSVGNQLVCSSPPWSVAEIIVWSRTLSDADLQVANTYFQDAYNLTNTLATQSG